MNKYYFANASSNAGIEASQNGVIAKCEPNLNSECVQVTMSIQFLGKAVALWQKENPKLDFSKYLKVKKKL